MAKKKTNDYGTGIPLHEVEALARILLPQIQAFFESAEGQKEFAEWKVGKTQIASGDDLTIESKWDIGQA